MSEEVPFFLKSNYAYIQIPKDLYRNPIYQDLSNEAKIIYGFLLDRARLSYQNGQKWRNQNGETFVFYTQKEVAQRLHCGHDKAGKIMKDLENSSLIRRVHQKPGLPPRIEVLEFLHLSADFPTQRCLKTKAAPIGKSDTNKNINKNNQNKTENKDSDSDRNYIMNLIQKQIQYDLLLKTIPDVILDLIVRNLTDAVSSNEPTQNIAGRVWQREELKQYLLSLDAHHVMFAYESFLQQPSDMLNPQEYFLPRLCQADEKTIDDFYASLYGQLPAELVPSKGA